VHDGKAKIDIEHESGSGIPAIQAGQTLQIKQGDVLLAHGDSKVD
jgi:hypothetical protein